MDFRKAVQLRNLLRRRVETGVEIITQFTFVF